MFFEKSDIVIFENFGSGFRLIFRIFLDITSFWNHFGAFFQFNFKLSYLLIHQTTKKNPSQPKDMSNSNILHSVAIFLKNQEFHEAT